MITGVAIVAVGVVAVLVAALRQRRQLEARRRARQARFDEIAERDWSAVINQARDRRL